jgi:hypothetical protein
VADDVKKEKKRKYVGRDSGAVSMHGKGENNDVRIIN